MRSISVGRTSEVYSLLFIGVANLLTLLRHFSKKGYGANAYTANKNRLCERYLEIISGR